MGYPHPDYLVPLLTAKQLGDWLAFYRLEGDRENRAELRSGTLCALLAEINRDSAKRPEPFQPRDFMNYIDVEPESELTPDEIQIHMRGIFGV